MQNKVETTHIATNGGLSDNTIKKTMHITSKTKENQTTTYIASHGDLSLKTMNNPWTYHEQPKHIKNA